MIIAFETKPIPLSLNKRVDLQNSQLLLFFSMKHKFDYIDEENHQIVSITLYTFPLLALVKNPAIRFQSI
jgi:hypothetical protein